jgi:excisionase family DNA binding protein
MSRADPQGIVLKENDMRDDLLEGAASAAAYTGLSRRKIYRLVENGHLPCVKMGRRLYFRKSDLMKSFARCRPRPAPGPRTVIVGGIKATVFREPLRHERVL